MMAKVIMLATPHDGVITSPLRGKQGRPKPIVFGPDTEPRAMLMLLKPILASYRRRPAPGRAISAAPNIGNPDQVTRLAILRAAILKFLIPDPG